MARPVLFVLAGVNGAGKSSIGGYLLQRAGLDWFNPDTFARELVAAGLEQTEANGLAWQEGMRRLDEALAAGRAYAFETTLGGDTVAARLADAACSHDVMVWYCGLASPEHHLARVKARVAVGGHDIPEAKIRERWIRSRENLIALMPCLAALQVWDNSAEVAPGEPIPDPCLLLRVEGRRVTWPQNLAGLQATPEWAKPLVEAALALDVPPP